MASTKAPQVQEHLPNHILCFHKTYLKTAEVREPLPLFLPSSLTNSLTHALNAEILGSRMPRTLEHILLQDPYIFNIDVGEQGN